MSGLPRGSSRERLGKERGEPYRAKLVRLRRSDVKVTSDTDCVFVDSQTLSREVQVPHAKRGELAPSQACIGGDKDDSRVRLPGGTRESVNFLVREVAVTLLCLAWQVDAACRVTGNPSIPYSDVQERSEHAVSTDDDACTLRPTTLCGGPRMVLARRAGGPGTHLCHPFLNVRMGDGAQLHSAPAGFDIDPPSVGEQLVAGRLQLHSFHVQPVRAKLTHGGARRRGVNKVTGQHLRLDGDQESLRITLRPEAPFRSLAAIRLPIANPIPTARCSLVGFHAAHASNSCRFTY